MATKTLLVSVDCVLYVLKPYYAYEKCSLDVGDSTDMRKFNNLTDEKLN